MSVTSTRPETAPEAAVLVVEDEPMIRRILTRVLGAHGYRCSEAPDAGEALRLIAENDFALVMTDMNMPGDSGMDLIRQVSENNPEIATVMVTGVDDPSFAETALRLGAYGYIIKPFQTNEILITVSNALLRRDLEIENKRHREKLELMVKERTADLWSAIRDLEHARDELRVSQTETIERLTVAAEFRDDETAQHVQRMSRYCRLLAYKMTGDESHAQMVETASIMHDVGKIGIPDAVLLKPGKLTPDEYETMKRHAEYGHTILSGGRSTLLQLAARIALTHHEWVDGSGYPHGLSGSAIPIEGRFAAIADVFDALTTHRVYRRAFPITTALEMMKSERGTHFDPEALDVFLDSIDEVLRIKEEHD